MRIQRDDGRRSQRVRAWARFGRRSINRSTKWWWPSRPDAADAAGLGAEVMLFRLRDSRHGVHGMSRRPPLALRIIVCWPVASTSRFLMLVPYAAGAICAAGAGRPCREFVEYTSPATSTGPGASTQVTTIRSRRSDIARLPDPMSGPRQRGPDQQCATDMGNARGELKRCPSRKVPTRRATARMPCSARPEAQVAGSADACSLAPQRPDAMAAPDFHHQTTRVRRCLKD
jgi:hypothetical protein